MHRGRACRGAVSATALAAILVAALWLAACDFYPDPVGIPPDELYALVCVDSTLVYPNYPCRGSTTITIILTIDNPLAPADTTATP